MDFIKLFYDIQDSPSAEPATFLDVDIDGIPPRIFLPTGDPFIPPGPVRVREIARKARVRFVEVQFYRYELHGAGLVPVPYGIAYAWQGDNSLIHLYSHPDLSSRPPEVDEVAHAETYVRLMRALGYVDAFIDM